MFPFVFQVRSQFPEGAAIPDFPQYIVSKLGLDVEDDEAPEQPSSPLPQVPFCLLLETKEGGLV